MKTDYELWHAHNLFLNYAIQMGLPGLLAIVILTACLIWRFWRLSRSEDDSLRIIGACGLTLLAGMMLKNLTDDFFVRHQALLFWSVCGMFLGYAGHRSAASPAR